MAKDKAPESYTSKDVKGSEWERRGYLASPKIKPKPGDSSGQASNSGERPDRSSDE